MDFANERDVREILKLMNRKTKKPMDRMTANMIQIMFILTVMQTLIIAGLLLALRE